MRDIRDPSWAQETEGNTGELNGGEGGGGGEKGAGKIDENWSDPPRTSNPLKRKIKWKWVDDEVGFS